jgi:hypothetical protein
VEIEQTEEDGSEKRRVTATVRLNSRPSGERDSFEGEWLARIWQGESADSFRQKGGWPLAWERPTAPMLEDTMTALVDAAFGAIARAPAERKS